MGPDFTSFSLDGEVVVRLLAAALLSGIVGVEREVHDQPAGLRTHIAVGLGAGLFGVISTLGFTEFDQPRAETTLQADVTRVASNVVVGIGFLGAGVIFRQGASIRNLTTAASLWTVAAIGLAAGVGDVATAAVATAILVLGLVALRPIRSLLRRRWMTTTVSVRMELRSGVDPGHLIEQLDHELDLELRRFGVEKQSGRTVLTVSVNAPPAVTRRWVSRAAASPDVETVTEA